MAALLEIFTAEAAHPHVSFESYKGISRPRENTTPSCDRLPPSAADRSGGYLRNRGIRARNRDEAVADPCPRLSVSRMRN